jgi:hypothetical protein
VENNRYICVNRQSKTGMNRFVYFLAAIFALSGHTGCESKTAKETSGRLYFFENEDRAIIVPVTINDSVRVENALFDTGASDRIVQMDSTFCATHPLSPWSGRVWNQTGPMTGWDRESDPKWNIGWYNTPLKIGMCGVDMPFERVYTVDGSRRIGKFDATFSFSAQDTTHVWEMNFRHNYLEAHDAAGFTMPEDCRVFPLVTTNYPLCVRFPVKVTCADGATAIIDETCIMDTGALSALILLESAAEYDFFRRRDDAVLLAHWNNRRYEVDAEVFDGVRLDGMRVYLNDGSTMLNDSEAKGIIGLNFLKRFNVYFDLNKGRVGFQPIKGFKRPVNLDFTRQYIIQSVDGEGNPFVEKILDLPYRNPYREAGMMAGDIVTAINGTNIDGMSGDDWRALNRTRIRKFDILRDGEPVKLTVRFDELGE